MNRCDQHNSCKFLAGEMSPDEVLTYESHLEVCSACCAQLENSSGSRDDWECVHDVLSPSGDSVAMAVRTDEWRREEEETAREAREVTSAIVQAILAPSDDPAMIGRVGPYEIAGIVGRGGAGLVLKGFDRALGRYVAIKLLDPALASVGAARQRFFREARAMAAISHEHVAPVYEVSEHGGLPYLVMEYVPGGSLEKRLRENGPFDALSIARIGLQIAQALDAAHRQGLVHRDIKPGNILLDRGIERVRVADFGLARVANDVSYTKSGFIAGTPQFMSPEQVRAEACDAQSDLFSLGAVLYALATGHAPFRAETIYGVMQRIVHDEPRPIAEQNPSIPAWLEAFITKLLAKDRAARFASADEAARILSDELAHLQNPGAAAPKRQWLEDGKVRPVRQRRYSRVLAMSLAATAIVICILAAAILPRLRGGLPAGAARSDGSAATNPPQPSAPQTAIPNWDRDGAYETISSLNVLSQRWFAPAPPVAADPWEAEANALAARLTALENELDPPKQSTPITFQPSITPRSTNEERTE